MENALVVDMGSIYTKVGLAEKEHPSVVFSTLVGEPRFKKRIIQGGEAKGIFFGEEVIEHSGVLRAKYPVRRGSIHDWDLVEALLLYGMKKAGVNATETPVLFAYPPFMGARILDKVGKIFFDSLNVPALGIFSHPYLVKQRSSEKQGLIVESGGGFTSITPLIHGRELLSLSALFPIAGIDVTNQLVKVLEAKGYTFTSPAEKKIIREMKEKLCYFASDFDEEAKKGDEIQKNYTLPDGRDVTLREGRFESPEVMYRPREIGRAEPPLHEKIYEVIQRCDMTLQPQIVKNIILSGGNTLISGFKERLHKELHALLPSQMQENLSISKVSDPRLSVWLGGSVTAS
ncbi:MAG: actin family protein, partial [Candidatus Korarchaeota archaeon]|nr:actin family protein [Candidatus Korarchaeota archaeon]NIU84820.1 hypothetical protein [Candidatus Thorarchaeota archaeon]NIW14219.1 hypothetical protein [Candidatus Thorarchaeota archaeon]NIW52316.1 hypothetical protein [Candidatus Korarchaeota archaeon]